MIRHAPSLRRVLFSTLLIASALPALAFGSGAARAAGDTPHAVYTLSNAVAGNAVLVYSRAADGSLTARGSVPTGGLGTGSGLGSQGAVILSNDGAELFAVNAGSNTISSFRVSDGGLSLVSQVWSGGIEPISLTVSGDVLYVLNAGSKSIAGFQVGPEGALSASPIAGSIQPLNSAASSPEEIAFNPAGDVLLVTDKGSGQIDTFTVRADGSASGPTTFATGPVGPYAVTFNQRGAAIVADAGIGAASSYTVSDSGALTPISSQIPDFHAAPCWITITNNGKYAYTANAHDGTISSYSVAPDGSLTLLQAIAAGPIAVPVLDLALSNNSHFLYAVDAGSIVAYTVSSDGSLTPLAAGSGLTAPQGLAAN
jgi:6-phosphogluconolactonase (cycloisomerase 2 family)